MPKRLFVTVLALVLSVTGVVWSTWDVSRGEEAVTITEKVISGDPAAAAGLTVSTYGELDNQLFWDTAYTVGEPELTHAAFTYHYVERSYEYEAAYKGVYMNTDPYADVDWETNDGLASAVQALREQTPVGQKGTATVYLKDYYEFYPLSISLEFPGTTLDTFTYYYNLKRGYSLSGEYDAIAYLTEYFKIPVVPEHTIQIDLVNDSGFSTGFSDENGYWMDSVSVLTDDACYFTFDCHYGETGLVDLSYLPDGYGIFRMPYTMENDAAAMQYEQLSMVYPLDPNIELWYLRTNEDKDTLYLHTIEDGCYVVTVIDCATMQTVQRLEVCRWDMEFSGIWLYEYPDFFCTLMGYEKLAVIAKEADGEYAVRYILNMRELLGEELFADVVNSSFLAFAFDGQKLAIVSYLREDRWNYDDTTCGFRVLAFDKNGMLYHGEYYTSLNTPQQSVNDVNPVYKSDIALTWN